MDGLHVSPAVTSKLVEAFTRQESLKAGRRTSQALLEFRALTVLKILNDTAFFGMDTEVTQSLFGGAGSGLLLTDSCLLGYTAPQARPRNAFHRLLCPRNAMTVKQPKKRCCG